MATVAQDIEQIKNATYGREVRTAIADGIQQSYNIVQKMDRLEVDAETTTGSVADATISEVGSGDTRRKKIVFSIPRGATGPQGAQGAPGVSPSISMGTVTTVNSSSNASATITGPQTNLKLNLSIPRGAKGDDGTDAAVSSLAAAYSSSKTYPMGSFCTYNSKLYRCTTPITTAKEWDANDWTAAQTSRAVMGAARIIDISKFPDANDAETNRIYLIPTSAGQTDSNYVLNLPFPKATGILLTLGYQAATGSDATGSVQMFISTGNVMYTRYRTGANSFTSWINLTAQSDPASLYSNFAAEYIDVPGGYYMKDEMVLHNGGFYVAKTDNVPTGTWNSSNWWGVLPIDYFVQKTNNLESSISLLKDYYVPLFDSTKTYRAGSVVKYSGNDNILYVFRKDHAAGPWNSSEVGSVTNSSGAAYPITEWLRDTWNNFAPQYDSTRTYAVGEYVCWSGPYLYRCTTAITSPEEWNSNHWTRASLGVATKAQSDKIVQSFAMIAPPFDVNTTYAVGQLVEYNGVVYRMTYPHSGAWNSSHVTNVNGIANSLLYEMWRNMGYYYNGGTNYKAGDLRQKGFELYRCNTDLYDNEQWNSAHWTKINIPEAIFNTRDMFAPRFSDSTLYYPGQIVWHDRGLYRTVRSHQGEWDANDFVGIVASNQLFTIANSFTSQYSPARSYKIDDYCVIAGATYRCIEDIDTPEVFNEAHWYRISALGVCDAISSFIAPKFSTAKRYGIGEYCVRNNQLYRFTSPHLEGAWNANDVVQTNLSDTLSGVGTGVILMSPNGTRFRLNVANDGTLSASALE